MNEATSTSRVTAEGLPLSGLRIADFTWVGAGPFMTKPLADHGADVIKVESRGRTDVIRTMPPFAAGERGINRSGYFANRNSSKRSICLELQTAAGRELALRLVAECDVVVNNFTPGTMAKFGLGYEDVRRVNPTVVYLDMPMQGLVGPYAGHRGYGLSIGALAGFLAMSGYPDSEPVGSGTNYPDHVANPLHGAVAILAALLRRNRTGQGAHIEVAQVESTINILGASIVAASAGVHVGRAGNADAVAAPHGVYRCSGEDEWVALSVRGDADWEGLLAVLGRQALATESFETHVSRREHAEALDRVVGACTASWDAEELARALGAAGVPAARVADAGDVVGADPQLDARGHWVYLDHPEMGRALYDNIPYRLSRTPGLLRGAAPLLGADTRDVLTGLLGLDDSEYDRLAAAGAVG